MRKHPCASLLAGTDSAKYTSGDHWLGLETILIKSVVANGLILQ